MADREILEAIKELAVEQATLREKVEAYLRSAEKMEMKIEKLQDTTKLVQKHEIFVKTSLWLYAFIITSIGVKGFLG